MTEPQSTPEVNPLQELFHKILNLLPWHAEADVIAAREVINEELPKLFGRNTTPAGVVKDDSAAKTDDGDKASGTLPVNPEA